MSRVKALAAKAKGNEHFAAREYSDAVVAFTKAIELDSTDHVFFSNRSACHAELGAFKEALEDAKECVLLSPDWAKGYSRLGLAHFELGQMEEAKAAYAKGLALDPNNKALQEGAAAVDRRQAPNPLGQLFGPNVWETINADPQLKAYASDPSFVSKVYTLQSDPQALGTMISDPQIQQLFAKLTGIDFNAAPETADGFEDRQPEPPKPTETPPQAPKEEPEEDMRTDEEKQADALKAEGNAKYKKRDFDGALEAYRAAHALCPQKAVYLSNMAAVLMEQHKYQEVIETCQQAVDLNMTCSVDLKLLAKLHVRKATALLKLDKMQEAIDAYQDSLVQVYDRKIEKKVKQLTVDLKKKQEEAYLDEDESLRCKERGNAFFQEGKWTEAIAEYTDGIKRNPRDPKLYSNRSACFVKLMEWGKGMDDADKAIALDPTFVKAYLRKARIQHFLKQYHKAIDTYKAALEMCPESQELRDGLMETQMAISSENAGGVDPERQKRAMEDPEIQRILQDPQMQQTLQSMQSDPAAAAHVLQDPGMRAKIEKLVAAGIIQTR